MHPNPTNVINRMLNTPITVMPRCPLGRTRLLASLPALAFLGAAFPAAERAEDCNGNGLPDECQVYWAGG